MQSGSRSESPWAATASPWTLRATLRDEVAVGVRGEGDAVAADGVGAERDAVGVAVAERVAAETVREAVGPKVAVCVAVEVAWRELVTVFELVAVPVGSNVGVRVRGSGGSVGPPRHDSTAAGGARVHVGATLEEAAKHTSSAREVVTAHPVWHTTVPVPPVSVSMAPLAPL